MLPIALLLTSLAIASATDSSVDLKLPIGEATIDVTHFDFPPLKNVSEQAKKDFANILMGKDMTVAQLEAEVKSWATKNGVLDAVNVEIAKDDQKKNDQRVNVTRALNELPAFIAKVNAIEDNKTLTITEIYDQTVALYDTIKTPYVRRLLETISYPDFVEGEQPGFSVSLAAAKRR